MERYDYRAAVKADVLAWVDEHIDNVDDLDELRTQLNDDLWIADSVTGNASGSYTFSTWDAEENICHNLDLLEEALEAFGDTRSVLELGAETCDVTIRCYLLSEAIDEAIEELKTKGE